MSVKVPDDKIKYQSHHHCQCDFCNKHRSLNAKKFYVSQRAFKMQGSFDQSGCCCACHTTNSAAGPNGTTFDPNYPEPVNQTALNASAGRTGLVDGDRYTTSMSGRPGGMGTTNGKAGGAAPAKSREEQEKEAHEDLDRLERLLIMEHKARVKAATEADRLGTMRTTGKEPRPYPMDATNTEYAPQGTSDAGGYAMGDETVDEWNAGPRTIREAHDRAQRCSVTPPAQCHSSHNLQHTMDDIRAVARDPVNKKNREALNRLLDENGMLEEGSQKRGSGADGTMDGSVNPMHRSLARVKMSTPRPYGTGVVWRAPGEKGGTDLQGSTLNGAGQSNYQNTFDSAASLAPGAAAALAVQQQTSQDRLPSVKNANAPIPAPV